MSKYFEWMDSYSVGVARFDNAHKRLIGIIDAFCSSSMEGRPIGELAGTFTDLIRVARLHFRDEEEWMQQTGFPLAKEHRARHDHLFDQLLTFAEAYFQGRLGGSAVTEFLIDWLLSHIRGEDMRYRGHSENVPAPGELLATS